MSQEALPNKTFDNQSFITVNELLAQEPGDALKIVLEENRRLREHNAFLEELNGWYELRSIRNPIKMAAAIMGMWDWPLIGRRIGHSLQSLGLFIRKGME